MVDTPVFREPPELHDAEAGKPAAEPGQLLLPGPTTPGYTYFTDYLGRRWTCCTCMAQFLTLAQRVALKRGLLKSGFDIWQLTGGATDSAGTHSQGGAFDLLYQTSDAWVKFFRDLGATATWRRTIAQGFSAVHLHGVLNGCVHNTPARYQVTEQRSGPPTGGGDGLLGTAPDPHPDPNPYRTWAQGVAAMTLELTPAVTTSTVIASTPVPNATMSLSTVTVRTTPATAGTHYVDYLPPGSTVWRNFKTIPTTGTSTFTHAFGATHPIRARFVPKDAAKAKGSTSSPFQITSVNLPALLNERDWLKGQVTSLQAKVTQLETQLAEKLNPKPPVSALGIDVSGNQSLDQVRALVANSENHFVFVKATEGESWVSPTYSDQWLASADLLRGAYHFAWANQDPIAEASNFLSHASLQPGDLVALDIEREAGGETWTKRLSYTLLWLYEVRLQTGAIPLVYTNWSWIQGLRKEATVADWEELVQYPCWLAEWTNTPGQFSTINPKAGSTLGWEVLIHQYGVVGNIDRDWTPDLERLRLLGVKQ